MVPGRRAQGSDVRSKQKLPDGDVGMAEERVGQGGPGSQGRRETMPRNDERILARVMPGRTLEEIKRSL